jgi:aspartyl-tRNA(Asn)/glutamyl-tRNA(Gln) amidotransferase subunit C
MAMIDVRHVALLARIALSDEETERMGKELAAILEYVKTLDALGLEDEKPLSHVHEDFAPPRPDTPDAARCLPREVVLAQAPLRDDTSFLVPPVVDTR